MKILAIGDLQEEFGYLDRLPEVVRGARAEAVVFTGNILRAEARQAEWQRAQAEHRLPHLNQPEILKERDNDARSMNRFFSMLGRLGIPVFLVPGKNDAPERFFLQAAFNTEVVAPHIYTVHRSFAPLGGTYVVAGFGGEITDHRREDECLLMYPQWEAQFALDFLRHLEQEKILLFHTAPEEKGEGTSPHEGHQMVNHLIKTYDPQFALCAHKNGAKGKTRVGNTLVVYPGRLSQGDYALLDTKEREVEFGNLR